MLTRWDKWFSKENLSNDKRIETAPSSRSAARAAQAFLARDKRTILDLACGIGRDTFSLASYGLSVIGSDASWNGLRVAQQSMTQRDSIAEWVNADARRLPFEDSSLEGIYCFGLLHEFTSDNKAGDVEQVMSEVRRVLRKQGMLVLTALAGDPDAGLPAVQMFTREMFEKVTQGLQAITIESIDDIGCTGRPDYHIWFGIYEK